MLVLMNSYCNGPVVHPLCHIHALLPQHQFTRQILQSLRIINSQLSLGLFAKSRNDDEAIVTSEEASGAALTDGNGRGGRGRRFGRSVFHSRRNPESTQLLVLGDGQQRSRIGVGEAATEGLIGEIEEGAEGGFGAPVPQLDCHVVGGGENEIRHQRVISDEVKLFGMGLDHTERGWGVGRKKITK